MIRSLLLLVLLLPALLHPAAAQMKIAGVSFEPAAKVDGQDLRLNGVGTRTVAWFTGYAAGLYLAQNGTQADKVMAAPGPKRLQLRMLVEVSTDEFIKAYHKGVGRNVPAAQQPALTERMAQFDAQMKAVGKVRKGDTINLDFVPAQGMLMSINGQPRGTAIPGADHYAALLSVFLGDRPVDDKMKVGLLAGRSR